MDSSFTLLVIRLLCGLELNSSMLDFQSSSLWDGPSVRTIFVTPGGDPSILRTYFVRPFWTLRRHPHRMILPFMVVFYVRPFWTAFVTFVGRSVHFVNLLLFVLVGLHVVSLVGWSVHLVDLILFPSILWTSNGHPCWMTRPFCGLYFASVHLVDVKWASL